jgi:hypothetical protein
VVAKPVLPLCKSTLIQALLKRGLFAFSVARSRDGSGSASRAGFSRLVLEIKSLSFDHQRAVVYLGVDISDVLAEDSHKKELK